MSTPLETIKTDKQQQAALEVMNALHAEGFTSLWLESVRMFKGGRLSPERTPEVQFFSLRVIVPDVEFGSDRMQKILSVAQLFDARVILAELHLNQQSFSRIAVWPRERD